MLQVEKLFAFGFLLTFLVIGCAVRPTVIISRQQDAPDYSQEIYWAALPGKIDSADALPSSDFIDRQKESMVDVFFLHPTTYIGQKGQNRWNAPILDIELINKTDKSTILHQASIFNGAGRVYAPRYRQAHLFAYYSNKDKNEVQTAFDIAYQDVKSAFLYYLRNYNNGRPIIIAAHSQGTTHAVRLLQDFFDGKAFNEKLVTAYLVGMPVRNDLFKDIPVCQSPEAFGCFCSWRSYRSGYYPKKRPLGDSLAVTNPLQWTTEPNRIDRSFNEGGILKNYHAGIIAHLADAKVHDGILWVHRPKFPGSFFFRTKNYHVADFNFFWVNVRNNSVLRAKNYMQNH